VSAAAPRRPLVAANWKMNHLRADAEAFCRRLLAADSPYGREAVAPAVDAVLFPSFPLLPAVAAGLASSAAGSALTWGGQDLHPAAAGAHTGDVSGAQLADAGCTWALVGHSERRHDHGEADELVAAKITAALASGLQPVLCLGESGDERRAGLTREVLDRQLDAALAVLPRDAAGFAVAYEPVWAIGTGETATPDVCQQAHVHLRRRVAAQRDEETAARLRILYGGSVKPGNAGELFAAADVDGFLVGGASLDADSFLAIIRACA